MPKAWHPKKWWNFLHVRRWEKRNITNFYRLILLIRISSIELFKDFVTANYTQRLNIVQKSCWTSCHVATNNYTQRLDIVQNFSCLIFQRKNVPEYILENISNNLAHKGLV